MLGDGDNDHLEGIVCKPSLKAACQQSVDSANKDGYIAGQVLRVGGDRDRLVGGKSASGKSLLCLVPGPEEDMIVSCGALDGRRETG